MGGLGQRSGAALNHILGGGGLVPSHDAGWVLGLSVMKPIIHGGLLVVSGGNSLKKGLVYIAINGFKNSLN